MGVISEHLLFEVPDPRKMASLPVAWMASTMADGAAVGRFTVSKTVRDVSKWQHLSYEPVPSMDTSWSLTLASTLEMPGSLCRAPAMSLAQPSQVMGTAKSVCFRFHQSRVSC